MWHHEIDRGGPRIIDIMIVSLIKSRAEDIIACRSGDQLLEAAQRLRVDANRRRCMNEFDSHSPLEAKKEPRAIVPQNDAAQLHPDFVIRVCLRACIPRQVSPMSATICRFASCGLKLPEHLAILPLSASASFRTRPERLAGWGPHPVGGSPLFRAPAACCGG